MGSAGTGPPPPSEFIRLYHLCSNEHALSNLINGRLKVARFSDANDPFELMALDFREKSVRTSVKEFRSVEDSQTGMLCFSSDWTSPILWSHYADAHRGICLGFDVLKTLVQPVNYKDSRIKTGLDDESGDPWSLSAELQDLLRCTKCHEWSYEEEQRVFIPLANLTSDQGFYFRPFDDQLRLAEVILGPKCQSSLQSVHATVASRYSAVRTFESRLAWKYFRVVPRESSVP